MQAKGRLQLPGTAKADGQRASGGQPLPFEGCAGKGLCLHIPRGSFQQRLPASQGFQWQPCREEAVQQLEVEAAARELEGFKGFKPFEAWQTAGLNALTREGYVQAKGRLHMPRER